MNIVLVGFMGTGKTVIAKELSKKLNREYVSLDNMIIQKEGKPVTRIFSEDGENYFREVEKVVTKKVSDLNNIIIDTGGGVVKDDENIKNLKKNGTIICLTASPNVIHKRVKEQTHRPLLNVDNPEEKIKELLNKRASFYAKADYTIDTSSLNINEVVEKIIDLIEK